MDLQGQVAMVTGASGGIGVEVANALAGRGAKIALTYRGHPAEASRTAERIRALGAEVFPYHLDWIDTNLRGAFHVTLSGFPGIAPMGSSIALAVSEAAIIQLTRCLAVALASSKAPA